MSGRRLEGRYRALLRSYPPAHRARHEEEMLGVLMAAARPGQRRPGLAESLNLVGGALRIRARAFVTGASVGAWQDTLALASVVIPMLIALFAVSGFAVQTAIVALSYPSQAWAWPWGVFAILPQLALAGLALGGLRRMAAVAATALLCLTAAQAAEFRGVGAAGAVSMSLLVVELAALLASPGPRPGLRSLTWRGGAALAAAGVAAGLAMVAGLWLGTVEEIAVAAAFVALATAAMVAGSARSRRLMAVLSVPAFYFVLDRCLALVPVTAADQAWTAALAYLPLAALAAAAAAVVAARLRVRADAADGTGQA